MHSEEKARCEEFGEYLVSHGTTVREAARYFGMSKSTVHKDVTTALKYKNPALAEEVAELLGRNKAQRHLRGGEATRRRYAEKRRRQADGDAVEERLERAGIPLRGAKSVPKKTTVYRIGEKYRKRVRYPKIRAIRLRKA
ncbi:MAG: sporulation transcriptional regulator SpoIIID [Christensenellales bacterium]